MKKFLLSIFAVMLTVLSVQAQTYVYQKVTSAPSDWSGDYLIVYEAGNVAFNGGLSKLDAASNNISVNISNGEIEANTTTNAAKFTIAKYEGGYSIKSASEYYIGATSDANSLNATRSELVNTISWEDGSPKIVGAKGAVLRYNAAVNNYRFRFFKSTTYTGQKAIALYKYTEGGSGEGGGTTEPETPVAPDAPTLPASCNFDNSMTVTITNIAADATAYYTIDGSTPTATSTKYTTPFEITTTTTVKAVAINEGGASDVISATYTKNESVTPPADGEVTDVLDRELTGVANNAGYSAWNGKKATSDAVYAGQSAGGYSAIQLRTTNSNSGIVTTKSGGKVKKIVVEWSSGTTSGRTLDVYGKNTAYTDAADLYSITKGGTKIGSIVCGTSTELAISDDYEYIGLRSNSGALYLAKVSITWDASTGATPVAPAAPVLTESQTFKGSMMVSITSDATVYYTTDGTTPSATNGTMYTDSFEITATTTVKAVAVNEVGESEVAEATYTLFVVEETEGFYLKVTSEPADWTGKYLVVYEDGADAYVFNGKDQANGYVAATIDGAVIKANGELDAVAVTIAAVENGYSIETSAGYIYGVSNSNALKFGSTAEMNAIAYVDGEGVKIVSNTSVLRFNSASNGMRFRYYKSETYDEQKPVQLYKYVTELPSYTLNVTDAGYATLFLDFNAAIPAGVEAYTVTAVNNGYVTLTQVEGAMPANTGVIVKAGQGDYTFAYSTGEAADVTGNLLKGTVTDKNIEGEAYVLGVDEKGVVGLYKAAMTGTSWKNNANKAYLPMSAVANKSAEFFGFDWDGTTAIENVEVENASNVIYDLTGRKVNEITAPGIYIVNGVKRVVR